MNRTKGSAKTKSAPKKAPRPPPVHETSSEDDSFTESEVEEFVAAPVKDDTRRKRTEVKRNPRARGSAIQERPHAKEADASAIEQPSEPELQPGSAGQLLLLAMTRQTIPVPILYHETNTYIPDCANMFIAVKEICDLIHTSTKLAEICPDFSSIGLSLYYAHVYHFQILRAREEAGTITRFERRSLKIYESISKPEGWPIAAPLSGFVQALGAAQPYDRMYSTVSPALPDYAHFTSKQALQGLSTSSGIGRTPIVPAVQEFLRLYSSGKAVFNDETATYTPIATPLGAQTEQFLGLTSSGVDSLDFQTLTHSSGWFRPSETEEPIGYFSSGQRQTKILRWAIPTVSPTADFSALETYLFSDQNRTKWISNLLRVSDAVCKFFPGSTNLLAIPPLTRMETFTQIKLSKSADRPVLADVWYNDREGWKLTLKAKSFGDESTPFVMASAATATNSEYGTPLIPSSLSAPFAPNRVGPYFGNPSISEGVAPLDQCEAIDRQDPTDQLNELINSMFDNRALE